MVCKLHIGTKAYKIFHKTFLIFITIDVVLLHRPYNFNFPQCKLNICL